MLTLFLHFIALLVVGVTAAVGEPLVLTGSTARSGNDARSGQAFIDPITDAIGQ